MTDRNDQNTKRQYRRYETMRDPAQNTQTAPYAQSNRGAGRTASQPAVDPRTQTQTNRDVPLSGMTERTASMPNPSTAAQPTVKNPPGYGMTRPNLPPGNGSTGRFPANGQPTQPNPRMSAAGYNPQGYSTRIEAPIPYPVPRPAAPIKRRTPMYWIAALIVGVLSAGSILAVLTLVIVLAVSRDRIPNGVSVAGFEIGGQTLDEARASIARLPEPQITLVDGVRSFQVRLSDLGGTVDTDATLQAAQTAAPNTWVPPQIRIDLAQAQFGLVALSDVINIDAVPGNPPQIGRSLEIPVMLDRLRSDATGELADGIFELNMIEVEPPPLLTGANASPEARTTITVEPGQELALIAREFGVTLDDIMQFNDINDPDLIFVGQQLVIPAAGPYTPAEVPAPPTNSGKAIVVSTTDQRIYAYENGQLVRSHLTSTGLPATPTVLGDYRVYVKYRATDMSGPGYYLPDVPYTMYFYQGYGIHGTYWHNSFGRPMSHGCVNLPTEEAQWFFNWAEVGTPVRVV
ncbi:MAG: L,D-transpeptidase family protein [bacterium]|nr:L,D-transpeptidase family protein [bacterium]